MRIVVAGGGTAGHIEPALNLADEIMRRYPDSEVLALGTARGLETRLVPERGYHLALIPAVPFPRRIGKDLVTLPARLVSAVRQTRKILDDFAPDVVVGFGGYVSIPAYLAARGRYPLVVHEANGKPGLANRLGARFADVVAQSVAGSLPGAVLTGNPLRRTIATLDRHQMRAQARAYFGLPADGPVLLVFGGSQGSARINAAVTNLDDVTVLHSYGGKNDEPAPRSARYVPLPYIDRMDLAYAAADLAVCRSGAMTVAEVTAVGLPACFVPFAVGNGEQTRNAQPVVAAGGALLVADRDFTSQWVRDHVVPLLHNTRELARMSAAAATCGRQDAAGQLADLVEKVAK